MSVLTKIKTCKLSACREHGYLASHQTVFRILHVLLSLSSSQCVASSAVQEDVCAALFMLLALKWSHMRRGRIIALPRAGWGNIPCQTMLAQAVCEFSSRVPIVAIYADIHANHLFPMDHDQAALWDLCLGIILQSMVPKLRSI